MIALAFIKNICILTVKNMIAAGLSVHTQSASAKICLQPIKEPFDSLQLIFSDD